MKINPHIRKEAVTFSSYDGYAHDNFEYIQFYYSTYMDESKISYFGESI